MPKIFTVKRARNGDIDAAFKLIDFYIEKDDAARYAEFKVGYRP